MVVISASVGKVEEARGCSTTKPGVCAFQPTGGGGGGRGATRGGGVAGGRVRRVATVKAGVRVVVEWQGTAGMRLEPSV